MTIIQISPSELETLIRNVVRGELKKASLSKPEEKLFTRAQAAQFLDISLPTLLNWDETNFA